MTAFRDAMVKLGVAYSRPAVNNVVSVPINTEPSPQYGLPMRDFATLARLSQENKPMFLKHWAKVSAMDRAEIRESVRLLWHRDMLNRGYYSTFLRITGE